MAIVQDKLLEERAKWDETNYKYSLPYLKALPLVKGKAVADLCCGLGEGVRILAREAKFVIGYDYSKTAIEECWKDNPENAIFEVLDVENKDFYINLDIITCMQGLEHLNDPQKLINKYKDCMWIFALPREKEGDQMIAHHKVIVTDELIQKWFGKIDIYHFDDENNIWLNTEDPERNFTNFYGVYKP